MASDAPTVLRAYLEGVFVHKDRAAIAATVFEDVIDHAGVPGQPPGRAGFEVMFDVFVTAFPDLDMTIEDLFGAGDRAVARWSAVATHSGELFGMPATDRRVTMTGVDIARVVDGKIVEFWAQLDMAGLMAQLTS